jgi:hypothetical protein
MSEFKLSLVQLKRPNGLSTPIKVYLSNELPAEGLAVRVTEEDSTHPETGVKSRVAKLSGEGLVASHGIDWFNSSFANFVNSSGWAWAVPVTQPTFDEVMAGFDAPF